MIKWKIYNEDAVGWAKNYQKGKFHALLCDAPYHLTSIVKRFGKTKESDSTRTSERVRNREDGYARLAGSGFMGATWDGGDLAFRPETWEAFGQVLYPGAFGMAFSASRNWHRMAVAIEDAGFILHPTIFLWAYSQGFPKATNIDKKIKDGIFAGHRYGLQALKPAVEPIIVFQKPYEGKPLNNIVETGAGALNIDGGRIDFKSEDDRGDPNRFQKAWSSKGSLDGWKRDAHDNYSQPIVGVSGGRWPSNFLLDESSAELLDAQTGNLGKSQGGRSNQTTSEIYGKYANNFENRDPGFGDSGGASRFFYCVQDKLDESDPVYYCSKVSPKERNAGLDDIEGDVTNDGRKKPIDNAYQRGKTVRKNIHPTVKPIDLMRYLATLLLPPKEYAPRRIFIPFSGSGSEMIGAGLAGWEHVVGVEFDTENGYVDIAKKRLEHWLK